MENKGCVWDFGTTKVLGHRTIEHDGTSDGVRCEGSSGVEWKAAGFSAAHFGCR